MKKFKKVMAMSCAAIMAVSAMSVSAFAMDTTVDLATLNYETASAEMQDRILEARVNEVFYGDQAWCIDGQMGVKNADGEFEAFPEFSDVFPGWDFDEISAKYDEMTTSAGIFAGTVDQDISVTSISKYYWSSAINLPNPVDEEETAPFTTFNSNSDAYIAGYAATLPTGSTINFGVKKGTVTVGYYPYCSKLDTWYVVNDAGQNYSVRASTYSNPCQAFVYVYACSSLND